MTEKDLLAVPLVDVDSKGIFKYILIKVIGKEDCTDNKKNIVRGYADCDYHCKHFINVCIRIPLNECLNFYLSWYLRARHESL